MLKDIRIRLKSKPVSIQWGVIASIAIAVISGFVVIGITARQPLDHLGAEAGGPFWQLPISTWLMVGLLTVFALFSDSPVVRIVSVVAFGLATMGALGYREPLGVLHDSWQNVGLGQLVVSSVYTGEASQVTYLASSPVAFLFFGTLRNAFPNMPSFLRTYPVLSVLFYCAGLYALATAFFDTHPGRLPVNRSRFSQMSIFAFLSLAPTFLVRVNPAPQSLAFALMPFCLAAMMKGIRSAKFQMVALAIFVVIVFTHSITALVTVGIAAIWLLFDRLMIRQLAHFPVATTNTVILYACIFLSWLIYVGVWILRSGSSFVGRMLEVLNTGQHATMTATVTETLLAFIWLHRVALGGGGLIVFIGLWRVLLADRAAGIQLIAWLAIAAAWLPLFLFGEFADRGPLFASLPAALAVGFALSREGRQFFRWSINVLLLVTALTGHITAYPAHIGEVITQAEVSAFQVLVRQSTDQKIIYGYAPPLTDEALPVYSRGRIRIYALGAADFSYERLTLTRGLIIISDNMREAAALRGPQALTQLVNFKTQLLEDKSYELIFDNGSVVAFRAKQP